MRNGVQSQRLGVFKVIADQISRIFFRGGGTGSHVQNTLHITRQGSRQKTFVKDILLHIVGIAEGTEILPFFGGSEMIHRQNVVNAHPVQFPDQSASDQSRRTSHNILHISAFPLKLPVIINGAAVVAPHTVMQCLAAPRIAAAPRKNPSLLAVFIQRARHIAEFRLALCPFTAAEIKLIQQGTAFFLLLLFRTVLFRRRDIRERIVVRFARGKQEQSHGTRRYNAKFLFHRFLLNQICRIMTIVWSSSCPSPFGVSAKVSTVLITL